MRFDNLRRRDVITLLNGTAAWPLAARVQQSPRLVIGFLHGATPGSYAPMTAAFHKSLGEAGCFEGQNVTTEHRGAEG